MGSSRYAQSLAVSVKWESPVPGQSVEEYYQAQRDRAVERHKAEQEERAKQQSKSKLSVKDCVSCLIILVLGLYALARGTLEIVAEFLALDLILDLFF